MSHITPKSFYDLQKRLDGAPQGAPSSDILFEILEILFSEKEAKLVTQLPYNYFTDKKASAIWKLSIEETRKILEELADKGILLDIRSEDLQHYILAPPMAGFFEFSLMRTDGRFDRKILSELFYQYITKEDNFSKKLFTLKPSIGRVFPMEESLPPKVIVLDYERASHIIKTANCITVGTCYCRHKMEHLGKACNNPQRVCLSFNGAAESLTRHKIAEEINKDEALDILNECVNLGLVQMGDNVQDGVNWICNCCSCCCEGILARKKFKEAFDLTSNFISVNIPEKCLACGLCIKKCPVDAISIEEKNGGKYAKVNSSQCIGCGICVKFCPSKSLFLKRKNKISLVPKDGFERIIMSAIDSGTLQNYIFDNPSLLSHSILKRIIGYILSLPPSKQLLAQKQLRSRFLNILTKTKHYNAFDKLGDENVELNYNHEEIKKITLK